ncbi:unnamed protein product, partial [Sphacelaria rigidula]
MTPTAPNMHPCRGGCGGRLHGRCGKVGDREENQINRICRSCSGGSGSGLGLGFTLSWTSRTLEVGEKSCRWRHRRTRISRRFLGSRSSTQSRVVSERQGSIIARQICHFSQR